MPVVAVLVAGTVGAFVAAPTVVAAPSGPDLKLTATDDTYTSSLRPTFNFGQDPKLAVGRFDGDVKVSFLKFVVPAGTAVTGARLTLTTTSEVMGQITASRVAANDWTENKLTSAGLPAVGRQIASASAVTGSNELAFDLGSEITGPGTYSFAVQSSSTTAVTRIRSAETGWGGPELTVTTAAPVKADKDAALTTAGTAAAPVTAPATTKCVTKALLVPSCGVLWGAAAGGFTDAPRDQALKDWEKLSGRTATIYHTYHKGAEPFPTQSEIDMVRDAAHPRVLLVNWKIAYGSTWAKVAAGEQDARIDAFAKRIKAGFQEKFFLVLNHEPENDVIAKAGSGMQAKDFAAMERHTILRLRAKGVTNAVNVLAYMGNERWMAQSWWKDLYPGDDVIDWIGLDSYVSVVKGTYHYGMFADLLDRKATTGGLGFYDWAVAKHPNKPFMVAEWGAYHSVGKPVDKSAQFAGVLAELAKRPQIKAIVYFDTAQDDQGDRDISINSMPSSLTAFKKLASNPIFNVRLG